MPVSKLDLCSYSLAPSLNAVKEEQLRTQGNTRTSAKKPRRRRSALARTGGVLLCAWLAMAGGWFAWQQLTGVSQESVAQAAGYAVPVPTGLRTKPIKTVKLGERGVGVNPIREQADTNGPDPATWREIRLLMRKPNGLSLWMALLRHLDWIEEHSVELGSTISLDMAEMGAVGEVEVTHVGPCPPIASGTGPVVTGKFIHQSDAKSNVIRLRLEGQQEDTTVTAGHRYWSADRNDYIEIGKFRVGELVDTKFGLRRVESITPHSEFEGLLYNVETTEHVYRVGSVGTLVHNSCVLTRYSDDFGHHIFSKRAFEGLPGYSKGNALSIGQKELQRLNLKHLSRFHSNFWPSRIRRSRSLA